MLTVEKLTTLEAYAKLILYIHGVIFHRVSYASSCPEYGSMTVHQVWEL